MQESGPITVSCCRGYGPRRLQRVLILTELRGICLKIGRLQRSAAGRLACREVAGMLDELLARETISRAGRRH